MNPGRRDLVATLWYIWGASGLAAVLVRALAALGPEAARFVVSVERVPLALMVIASVGTMAWVEGFRGFQRGLIPRLITRSRAIAVGDSWVDRLLAPAAALELVRATPRRLARRWCLVGAIAILVVGTRSLSDPWRGLILAGVVAGLSWGLVSLLIQGIAAGAVTVPNPDPPPSAQGNVISTAIRPGTAQPR